MVGTAGRRCPSERGDDLRLAICAIVLTALVLSLGDTLVKFISTHFSLWQICVLRSLLAMLALTALLKLPAPGLSVVPVSIRWTLLRSVFLTLMWVIYYTALPHVHLSALAAVLYTIPLFITLFSALFTDDRVGWTSWAAVILGFAGVLVIVRPAAADFSPYAILPLFSAIFYVLAMILTRTKCRRENPKVLALWQNLVAIVIGAVASVILLIWQPAGLAAADQFLFGGWVPLTPLHWLAMAVLASIIVIANIAGAVAYQRGPPPVVATFDYSYLVFSTLLGLLIFSEVPDMQSAVGIVMIAVAGIVAVRQPRAWQ